VREPKHVVTKGATPVLSPAEARKLLESIDTPDDHTVVFSFTQPYAALLQRLNSTEAPILPKHIYEGVDDVQTADANLTPVGTGPFSDFLTTYGTRPMRLYLSEEAWPVVVLFFGFVAWWASGKKLLLGSVVGTVVIGLLGMWTLTMDTLSQTVVAVLMAIVIGLPLGVAASRRDWLERGMRPVLDTLQTIPSFCFLVPVVILFNVGRIPGIIASVLYAIPPVIRLTNLGIRSVDSEIVEASESFGVTRRQKLWKIQLPLAMPTVLAGINQTVMLVLAMVVIAGLVGGAGLGLEAVKGLARSDTGLGFEAGASIVILAMILDRITQGWAARFQPPSSDRG